MFFENQFVEIFFFDYLLVSIFYLLKSVRSYLSILVVIQPEYLQAMFYSHRKIRLIEDNAKCRHLKIDL
jgi:hypothetical protein